MIRPLIRRWRQNTQASLAASSRKGMAMLLFLVMAAGYFIWIFGNVYIFGIPLQVIVISFLVPVFLCVLLFWFARQQDRHAWQSDDED